MNQKENDRIIRILNERIQNLQDELKRHGVYMGMPVRIERLCPRCGEIEDEEIKKDAQFDIDCAQGKI